MKSELKKIAKKTGFIKIFETLSDILQLNPKMYDSNGELLYSTESNSSKILEIDQALSVFTDSNRNNFLYKSSNKSTLNQNTYAYEGGISEIRIPIFIDKKKIAELNIGYFFLRKPNYIYFKKIAESNGIDVKKFNKYLSKMPFWSSKQLSFNTRFIEKYIFIITDFISLYDKNLKNRQKFKQNNEKFNILSDNSNTWETWINPKGKILRINNSIEKITGFTIGEYKKLPDRLSTIIYPEDRENMLAQFKKALRERKPEKDIEFRILCKDKTIKWASVSYQPIIDTKEKYYGIRSAIQDITARKNMEFALRNSERKFREMFNTHNAIMLLISPVTGSIIDANLSAVKFYGYSHEEFVKMNINQINILPDEEIKKEMSLAEREKRNYFIFPHLLSDKTVRIVEIHSTPIEYENQRQLFSIIHDITVRKQKEEDIKKITHELAVMVNEKNEKLIHAERKYHSLFNKIKDGIIFAKPDGNILEVNEACYELLGYSNEEIQNMNLHDITPEKWHSTDQDNFHSQVLIRGYSGEYEKEIIHKNGSLIPVLTRIYTTEISKGKPKNLWVIVKDLTKSKESEINLKESELKFRTIADFTYDWEYWIDQHDKLLYTSPSSLTICGYSKTDILSDPSLIEKIIHPEDTSIYYRHLNNEKPTDKKSPVTFRIISKDGSIRWIEHRCLPVYNENGDYLGRRSSNRDVTDIKNIEDKLRSGEESMRAILNAHSQAVFLIETNGTLLILNEPMAKRFNSSVDSLKGKNYYELLDKEIAANRKRKADEVLSSGLPVEFEDFRNNRYIYNIIYPVFNEDKISRLAIIGLDITEQKMVEFALAQKTEEIDRFFNLTLDLLCIADINGDFKRLNNAWENTLGFQLNEIEGRNFLDFIHPEDLNSTLDILNDLSKGKKVINFINRYRCKDGSYRWIEWQSAPYENKLIYSAARDITDKKISEANLYSLQIILERSLNEIYIFNPDTLKFIYVNSGARLNLQYNMENLKSMTPLDIKPGFTREEFLEMINPLFNNTKKKIEFYTYHRRADGSVYPVEVHLQLIETDIDRLFLAVVIDITTRKKTEEALAQLNKRFDIAVKSASLGIWDWDIQKDILLWDEKMFSLYEIDNNIKILNYEFWINKIYLEDRYYFNKQIEYSLAGKSELNCEFRIISKSGKIKYIKAFAQVIYDYNKAPANMVGVHYDITKQKEDEQKIYESEQMLRLVLDHIPQRVFWKDLHLNYLGCNKNFAINSGFQNPSDIIGRDDYDMSQPADAENYRNDDMYVINNDTPKLNFEESQNLQSGAQSWVRTNKIPLHDKNGKVIGILGSYEDITEKKLADARLNKLIEELEKSNKELEHFAYVASHDLQEPLRMVSSYTQLLAKRYKGKLDSDADEFIDFAVDGAIRMQKLINDLLEYSRIFTRGNRFSRKSVNSIINAALLNLKLKIDESGAEINRGILPVVNADAYQLTRVFQNLIDNSIKYRSGEKPVIEISAEERSSEWLFIIKDNGFGFDMKFSERIFEIFQRLHTRDKYPGTGIGLSVCKRIIERHGGKIWVISKPNAGSTFYFTIAKMEIIHE